LFYALQGFIDALDSQITTILAEQLNVTWGNYIHHSVFSGKLSDAQVRQRNLLLELSVFETPVSPNELRKRLSEKLLTEYEKKTLRAFHRDINYLERKNFEPLQELFHARAFPKPQNLFLCFNVFAQRLNNALFLLHI
jgi:CRISPR/Cas system-associated protein Csx1